MTIYYVDPAGNDGLAGTSTGTAWQTITKVNASSFSPGDQVLFKQDGVWRGVKLTPPSSGTVGQRVVFGSYGSGAAPIISGGVVVTGWSVFSGATYSASIAASTSYVLAGSTPLTLGSGSGTLTANQFFYAASTLYVNLGGTNPASVVVEASQLLIVVDVSSKSYVTLQDVEVRFSNNAALSLGTATSPLVQRCTFRYHAYTSNSGTVSISDGSGARVTNCVFDNLQNDGVWVHASPNAEIDNNTFTNIGVLAGDVQSDGIQFENTFGTTPNSDGAWIHHNTITMGGSSTKGGILVNVDPSISGASSSAIIEYNTITGGNYGVAPHASNCTVRFNTCANQVSSFGGGIHIDSAGSYTSMVIVFNLIYGSNRDGIVLQDGAGDHQVTIANNTIVDCGRAQMYLGSPVYGTIADNILWNTGAAPSLRTLYILSVTAGQTLVCDYNLLQTPFASYLRFGGTAYSTLAAWRSATSLDTHSISSDPLFVDSAARAYSLRATSPARDAGVVVPGIGQVVLGSAPDIGFAEYASGLSGRLTATGVGG